MRTIDEYIEALKDDRAPPSPPAPPSRAAIVRLAADLVGSEKLASLLGVSSRHVYLMMAGKRTVKPGILADTRELLIAHRQSTADAIAQIRAELERSSTDAA